MLSPRLHSTGGVSNSKTYLIQVCKACGDAAVSAVRDAVQVAQQEASNLQLQLLDLESDVLFDFNNMQTEILDLQHAAENLQRQLEESDQKRYGVRPTLAACPAQSADPFTLVFPGRLNNTVQCRLCEQQLKQELEQQVLQLSDEVLNLKLALAFPPEREQDEQTLGKHDFFGRPDAARLAVGFHAEQPGTPDQDCELKGGLSCTTHDSWSSSCAVYTYTCLMHMICAAYNSD